MRLEVTFVRARLHAPFVSARGAVHDVELVLATVTDAEGNVGHGEVAALGERRASQIAAVDLARWDLEGHRTGVPVWRLLGASSAPAVEVNATIATEDREGAATAAAAARAAGFGCVKVKVGIGDDAGRLAAVRAVAGPTMAIRIDANGAWSVAEAIAALRALAPIGIECCEEPCSSIAENEHVAAEVTVPISLDESAALPGAFDRRVCAAVCLKLVRCGGITGLLDDARRARAVGYEVYLASSLDGPLGIAAALQAAAVVQPDRACGLATMLQLERDCEALEPVAGRLALPAGPGLGDGLTAWYERQ